MPKPFERRVFNHSFPALRFPSLLSAVMSLMVLCLLIGTLIVPSAIQTPSQAQAGDNPIPVPTSVVDNAGDGGSNLGGSSGAETDNTDDLPPDSDDPLLDVPDLSDTPQGAGEIVVLNEDFELDLAQWQISADAALVDDGTGNHVAQLPAGASLTPLEWTLTDYKVTLWFYLVQSDDIELGVGDERPAPAIGELSIKIGDSYTLLIGTDGTVLYNGEGATKAELSKQAEILAESATATSANNWHQLDLRVSDAKIGVSIDGADLLKITTRTAPIASFALAATQAGSVWLDDVSAVDKSAVELVIPVTPAPKPEVISSYDPTKMGSDLTGLLDTYNTSGEGAALELAKTYLADSDAKARVSVEIWGVDGTDGAALSKLVEAAGGKVETIDYKRVSARLGLAAIASLSLSEQVSVITLTPKLTASADVPGADASLGAVSLNVTNPRDPIGDVITEGYELAGVQGWHEQGYDGAGVKVGVIDIGFGKPTDAYNDEEMKCLKNETGITLEIGARLGTDTVRGLNMLEVLCDVAPNSKVRLYKAQTTDELFDALDLALSQQNSVVVIGVDLGPNVSPGDGTLGYTSTKNIYTKIQEMRDAGVVVVVAAGNSNQSYVAVELVAAGTVTIPITAAPGTVINLGWNDWDSNPNGAAPREDFGAVLSGAGFTNVTKPARGSSNPGSQLTLPTSCTTSGGFCTATLTLNALSGNTSLIQVQASGTDSSFGTVTGGTIPTGYGRLTRPADADNAITVGAVCASVLTNYPNVTYSSRGPKYNSGGNFSGLPLDPFFTGDEVKPDVVGPTQVSTSFAAVGDLNACDSGFAGTQSAAAHVAGQVAVLLSNPSITQFSAPAAPADRMPNVLRYLRTHAAEVDFGADANGYDLRHGAGLVVLGQSNYNPDNLPSLSSFIAPDRLPSGECTGGLVYVGPYKVGNNLMDGSLQNPFNHLAHAVAVAGAAGPNRCVIVLPGEYPTPIYVNGLANTVSVYAYASVVRQAVNPSVMYVQTPYTKEVASGNVNEIPRYGGIYVDEESFVFSGFTFAPGVIYENATLPQSSVLVVDGAADVTFSNNTIKDYIATQELYLIQVIDGSTDVHIKGNRFIGNTPLSEELLDPPGAVSYTGNLTLVLVETSGADGSPVVIDANIFRQNKSPLGVWLLDNLPDPQPDNGVDETVRPFQWTSMIRSVDSYIDITNNTIRDNEFETIIQSITRLKDDPYATRILGNAIVNNTTSTNAPNDIIAPGPLIHLFFVRNTAIVNNTIANNNLQQSGFDFSLIIGRGDELVSGNANFFPGFPNNNNSGSLGPDDTFWEFNNNFLMDNDTFSPILNDLEASTVGCKDSDGTADHGARSNWIYNTGASGPCATSFDGNNNILGLDPYPRDENGEPIPGAVTYILGGPAESATTPGYYSLTGATNGGSADLDGIDEGDDTWVLSDLPDFAAGLDARGIIRRNDGDGDTTITIDMGAYEFTALELQDPIDLVLNEDNGPSQIELTAPLVTGGFPPYEVEITNFPRYYGIFEQDGSNCDARFTALAQGVVVEYLTDGTPIITYCPAPDFHTNTSDPDFTTDNANFEFNLTDASNSVAPSTIEVIVNPVDDNTIVTVLGNNVPEGDILDEPVAIGRNELDNVVRLRPFVDFTENFLFSEWNNLIEPTAQNEVDYDFVYGSTSEFNDPGNNDQAFILDNLVVLSASQGIIGIDLDTATPPVDGSAQVKLQYTVNDQRGGQVTNIVTIRAELPPSAFDLLTPPSASVFSDFSDIETFTWEPASPVQTYLFTIERVSGEVSETVIDLNLTPSADSDGLVCDATTCTMTLIPAEQQLLIPGDYRWSVIADNKGVQTVASNAPFSFKVQIGVEMLQNGSFELPQGDVETLAKYWKPANLDNDRRKCNKNSKIFAFELECAFSFTAKTAIPLSSNISQEVGSFGKPNERVLLSFYVNAKNLTSGGKVSVKLKYANGTKDKIKVSLAAGTYAYQNFGDVRTMPGVVKSAKVTIQMANGNGKFYIDAVSLVWETGAQFDLLTPVTNEVYTVGTDLTFLTWEKSQGSTAYDLQITQNNILSTPILTLNDLTPIEDSDGMFCNAKICRYTLSSAEQALLVDSEYSWEVTAKGGLTQISQNGPFLFTIDSTIANLIVNGDFETASGSKPTLPATWKASGIGDSILRCNKPSKGKYASYEGNCSFRFTGKAGYSGSLLQKPDASQIAAGNSVTLSAVIFGKGVKEAKGKVQAVITYVDDTSDKLTLTIPPGEYDFTLFTDAIAVTKAAAKVKVKISYTGGSGSFLIDNVTLLRDTTP